jgi:hypothetical protein
MRISASILCLAASLAAAPAFAQAKDGAAVSGPQTLASQPSSTTDPETQLNAESPRLNLGASFNKGTETSVLPLAPIEKDQLELSWKPGGKWGVTLDLTSRSENDILPREEFAELPGHAALPLRRRRHPERRLAVEADDDVPGRGQRDHGPCRIGLRVLTTPA